MTARTLEAIIQEIDTEKSSNTVLAVLTSNSITAKWKWLRYLVAYTIWIFESLVVSHANEIATSRETDAIGKEPWYAKQMYNFQYGDVLVWNDTTAMLTYPIIDKSKQIIKYSTCTSANGIGLVKVAKDDSGSPVELSGAELAAAVAYLDRIQIAGTNMSLLSFPADQCNFDMEVWHDGQADWTTIVEPQVQAAIAAYLHQLNFNGIIIWTHLVDEIQKINGVVAVSINAATVSINGATPIPFGQYYQTVAGYATPNTTIPSTITPHLI